MFLCLMSLHMFHRVRSVSIPRRRIPSPTIFLQLHWRVVVSILFECLYTKMNNDKLNKSVINYPFKLDIRIKTGEEIITGGATFCKFSVGLSFTHEWRQIEQTVWIICMDVTERNVYGTDTLRVCVNRLLFKV